MATAIGGAFAIAPVAMGALAFWGSSPGCFTLPPDGVGGEIALSFDFRDGLQKWSADIADFPVNVEDDLAFDWGRDELPEELGVTGRGLRVESFNQADDAFTFIKRRLGATDGIFPGRRYRVHFDILVASNAPSNCVGVGGAPGESVYLKAGASATEPESVLINNDEDVGLSVDVGDQATGGPDASVAGTIANGVPCDLISDLEQAPYVFVLRSHEHETTVTAGSNGALWLLIGVDSGFESLTRLYYLRVDVTLTPTLFP